MSGKLKHVRIVLIRPNFAADANWKAMRKACSQLLSKENVRCLSEYQRAETRQLVWELCHRPEVSSHCLISGRGESDDSPELVHHLKRYTLSFLLGAVYGSRGPTLTTPAVKDFLYVHPKVTHILDLGTLTPVDIFPFLALVPERWAKWKRTVTEIRGLVEGLYSTLLSTVEKRLASGERAGVFLEDVILNADSYGFDNRDQFM